MTEFLREKYGEPCRECGWSWSAPASAVDAVVDGAVERYTTATDACSGRERVPELGWNLSSYVFHVADNTRIWAERVVASARRPGAVIASWDEDALDLARDAGGNDVAAALWSLERAIGDWHAACALAGDDVVVAHPDQGPMSRLDVGRALAHELHHHAMDVQRIAC